MTIDLAARIQRLEDRAALQDLVVRYFVAADDNDLETIAASFAKDAQFLTSGFVCGSDRDSIVEFIRMSREHMGATIHTPNYTLLTFTDDANATGVVGAHLELAMGATTVFGAVRYLDNYARTETGWCFARREMVTIHVGDWNDVAGSLTNELRVRWPGQEPAPADLPR